MHKSFFLHCFPKAPAKAQCLLDCHSVPIEKLFSYFQISEYRLKCSPYSDLLLFIVCNQITNTTIQLKQQHYLVADPDFPRRGRQPRRGGGKCANLLLGINFAKNCMKIVGVSRGYTDHHQGRGQQ